MIENQPMQWNSVITSVRFFGLIALALLYGCSKKIAWNEDNKIINSPIHYLKIGFKNPPDTAKPGVYWYFMDGNLSKEAMTVDLESMKAAGIANLVFLEVNVGIPRGPVSFLSEQWQELFKHAVREAERLGIRITLGIGPGWTGSGGPWVIPGQSMQHLVSSTSHLTGLGKKSIVLPIPAPKTPYFGEGSLTPETRKQWNDFYEDVAVLAFPTPEIGSSIEDINEKALYYRAPYTSVPGTKQYLPSLADYNMLPENAVVAKNQIIDLTERLKPNGALDWEAPEGNWTIMRFGRRTTGQITRPAPYPGLGFEADKFDTVALDAHLSKFIEKILRKVGGVNKQSPGGLKMLHMDSWEMGAQNWTSNFREEFLKRRGYDPLPFYPVYAGHIIESLEVSERFLWDLRQTAQDLVLDYHVRYLKRYGKQYGLGLSIEPYDMNPTADMELGALADIPMCEFWSKGFGYNSAFTCIQAASIAHVNGQSVVAAEAFTATGQEGFKQHPGSMKEQGDWAFCTGINRFVYHTFQHQPLSAKPGMTMGPYGVHWDRNQTWWPMVGDYHRYIARCQFVLQQGRAVADILYLTPEGAPHVFHAPQSALAGDDFLPDRKGYNFDGCSPGQLVKATVKDKQIIFPGGASYRLLVLPGVETMTPALLEKIRALVHDGATVIGSAPKKAPGLSGYPQADKQVLAIANELWGNPEVGALHAQKLYGKGMTLSGGDLVQKDNLYPEYEATAKVLKEMGAPEDFVSSEPVRYTHRTSANWDIYFIANKTNKFMQTEGTFRVAQGSPEWWDPITGTTRKLAQFSRSNGQITIPLELEAYQSGFIVFEKNKSAISSSKGLKNFQDREKVMELTGSWVVSFDPKWGGPNEVIFKDLQDWSTRPEEGIKFYSGIAVYRKTFNVSDKVLKNKKRFYLDLGEVKNLAKVRLNGKDLGVVWTAPWSVDITDRIKRNGNQLEIEVANLWPNRLIGDEHLPYDGIKDGKLPDWLLNNIARTSGRYTFSTVSYYNKDSPLLRSGLLGPVSIMLEK